LISANGTKLLPLTPASGRSGWQSESPAISIWDQNPRLRGHSLGESYHPIRQFRDNYHIARWLMTLGWLLVCGLPNQGRRPADCRSEYRPGPGGTCGLSTSQPPGFPSTASRLYCFYLVPSVGTSCRFWKLFALAKPAQVGVCNTILPAKTASHNVQKKMGYSKGKL
jgi:hypothetical protein